MATWAARWRSTLCVPCQSIWFDARENLQLTPGATLALFRVIGEHAGAPAVRPMRDIAKCPRCQAQLRRTRTCSATRGSNISAARTSTAG